ncbi:MAG: hypothetical protein MJZ64_07920 [Paludibacteraceae bacterium]|nr:hypothetical protein [Paludibacteraceae bacterium]
MRHWGIVILLCLPLGLWAQGQGLQVALQGGAAGWQIENGTHTWSPEGGLDLRYIMRCRVGRYTQLGLHAGVGASYSAYKLKGDLTDHFTRQDYLGNTIQYTTSAHAEEKHQAVGVSVPLLFALQTHGATVNIGPKLLWLAYDRYDQTVDHADIVAFYPAYGVPVHNQPGTGIMDTPYSQSGRSANSTIHLLLTAEIGYEWQLGNPYSRYSEQYIGLQLYANYGLCSWGNRAGEPFMSVSSITATQGPQITTTAIQQSSALAYLSLGVRFYYTIQTVDYPGRGWHHYRAR